MLGRKKSTFAVPVTMGSAQFVERTTSMATVIGARFPANAVLAPHRHGRTIFGVMLEGGFESRIAQRRLDCAPAAVWTEPSEELHANYVGRQGAAVLIVQPDHAQVDVLRGFDDVLSAVTYTRDAGIAADARRIVTELHAPDQHSALVIDALILTMLSQANRTRHKRRSRGQPPGWLARTLEYMRESFRQPITLKELATIADVHPTHLAHAFRDHVGVTPGQQLRALRLQWAVERMLVCDEPLASVAARAGFSDQSHFTREFRRVYGTSPAAYRRTSGLTFPAGTA